MRRLKVGEESYSWPGGGMDDILTPQAAVDALVRLETCQYRRQVIYARHDNGRIYAVDVIAQPVEGEKAAARVSQGLRLAGIETTIPQIRDHRPVGANGQ